MFTQNPGDLVRGTKSESVEGAAPGPRCGCGGVVVAAGGGIVADPMKRRLLAPPVAELLQLLRVLVGQQSPPSRLVWLPARALLPPTRPARLRRTGEHDAKRARHHHPNRMSRRMLKRAHAGPVYRPTRNHAHAAG